MMKFTAKLLDQPYWIIALLLGVGLVALPCVTIDKDYHWQPHSPNTLIPVAIGVALLLLSSVVFGFTLLQNQKAAAGIDLTRVKESNGVLWTTVGDCEIDVISGRIEDQKQEAGSVIALPCNEYFDDECAFDPRSALGAYVNRVFDGQAEAFISFAKKECRKRLEPGEEQQKTSDVRAVSFGVGRCVLLAKRLGRPVQIALVSTATQRDGLGLSGRISYLFDGMRELITCLANARLQEIIMPVLGAGHAGIDPPLAFVGLLLAVAEAARYGYGGRRPKRVTIVVFRRDEKSAPQVDPIVVRRALALIGSRA